ncbi:hypothetical protein MGYG_05618 [Nannizzia gypsea CBS 118893]|uniref:Uncharacterized protein n=1 Tax=Arthroderma gypseum (strain ATCC MYA-4604 / CBS 118893) TaxID=535722 RepID=E4UWY1_ARTGP|nr:hypothetical protein MGYG_05618 [Nannizzia gypsea CBS 118893]EFR02620.1 hypothetical protein MGYG_05618 [Nannizzia gypsea CBS 118893]
MPALASPDTSNSQHHEQQHHHHHHQHTPGTKQTNASSSLFAHSTSKQPHEKAAAATAANAFLWNPDYSNGDTGDGVAASANFFVESRSRGPNPKTRATVSISPSRECTESVDSSSLRNGRAVSSHNSMADITTTPATTNGASAHHEAFADEHERWVNGKRPGSGSARNYQWCSTAIQTDYTGYPSTAELTPPSSSSQHDDVGPAPTRPPPPIPTAAAAASTSIPTTPTPRPTTLDTTNLAPESQPISYRHSSPPPQVSTTAHSEIPTSPSSPQSGRLSHRHTLQVPRHSSSRASRDTVSLLLPPSCVVARSPSLVLASVQTSQKLTWMRPYMTKGAARWTEAFKQRRASKRKRREEEDEDRVIVGTKVDQHHVNWVTAYNMLTGIRFTFQNQRQA